VDALHPQDNEHMSVTDILSESNRAESGIIGRCFITVSSINMWWVFVLALAWRIIRVIALRDGLQWPDTASYDEVARNLLAGNGFVLNCGDAAARTPGYPLFLAACYSLSGVELARWMQAIIGAATVFPICILGRRLFGVRCGRIAALMVAINPTAIYFCGTLLTETLFAILLACAVLALGCMLVENKASPFAAVMTGILLGASSLVRPSALLIPLFLIPVWIILRGISRRTIMELALIAVGNWLALSPWIIRNYGIYHCYVPGSLRSGESLYEALGPHADGGPSLDRMPRPAGSADPDEWRRNESFKNAAKEYALANPGRTVSLIAAKQLRFWNFMPNAAGYRNGGEMLLIATFVLPVYVLAVFAILVDPGNWKKMIPALWPAFYFAGIHCIFVGSMRYREPVMPMLCILSAHGLILLAGIKEKD